MTEGYMTTDDGVKLYYQKMGDSESVLIIPNALYMFEDFKCLTQDHTVVFYDLRNRGCSEAVLDKKKLLKGIYHDVEDLETVRRHFTQGKVGLIGHSYLGLMAFLYAEKYPHRIERIVQIGPMSLKFGAEYPVHLTAVERKPIPDPAKMEELQLLEKQGYPETHPEEYCKKWWSVIRPFYVTNPKDTVKLRGDIHQYPNEWPSNQLVHFEKNIFPSIQKLNITKKQISRVTMPVLTIHGRKDRGVPYGSSREWVYTLPNARLLTLDNGGHMPWIEDPQKVFAAIRVFLKGGWPAEAEVVSEVDFR